MRIHLYTILRNEERILPFFLRHYTPLVDRIYVFDDRSTDRTLELLGECPKVFVEQTVQSGIDDYYFRNVFSSEYKKRREECDWVFCVDVDEFIFHKRLLGVLFDYLNNGVKIVKCLGWTMFSQKFPTGDGQIYDEIKTGLFDVWQCKPTIFSPSIDIKFDLGRHGVKNTEGVCTDGDIKLLHYRYLGEAAFLERHAKGFIALSDNNRRHKLGRHFDPASTYYHSAIWYSQHLKDAVELPFLDPPRR